MPVCPQRGCGCAFTSETLTITPDSENSALIHIEQAEFTDITDMQDDIATLESEMDAAQAQLAGLTTTPADVAALQALVPTRQLYTPVLTGSTTNPNIGSTGTASGVYVRTGSLLFVQFYFAFGGTGISQGSGQALISLPASPIVAGISAAVPAGLVTIRDASASQERTFKAIYSSGNVLFSALNPDALGSFSAYQWTTLGFTFAASDLITGTATFYIP